MSLAMEQVFVTKLPTLSTWVADPIGDGWGDHYRGNFPHAHRIGHE